MGLWLVSGSLIPTSVANVFCNFAGKGTTIDAKDIGRPTTDRVLYRPHASLAVELSMATAATVDSFVFAIVDANGQQVKTIFFWLMGFGGRAF